MADLIGTLAPPGAVLTSPLTWDAYFARMAKLVAARSKDPSAQVGCVLARDHVVLATGYNGAPRGVIDYVERYMERPQKYAWIEHAERNAIFNAAKTGAALDGATAYVSRFQPCAACARALVQSGIERVVAPNSLWAPFVGDDRDPVVADARVAKAILDEGGVELDLYDGELP